MRCYVTTLAVIVRVAASCSMHIACRPHRNITSRETKVDYWSCASCGRAWCTREISLVNKNNAVICDIAAPRPTNRLGGYWSSRCTPVDASLPDVLLQMLRGKNTVYEFVLAYAAVLNGIDKNPVLDGCVI